MRFKKSLTRYIGYLSVVAATFLLITCSHQEKKIALLLTGSDMELAKKVAGEPIRPITKTPEVSSEKVELGFQLYHETNLSATGEISCATCHDLQRGGVDIRSESVIAQSGKPDSPTIFNAYHNFRQFWDGRAMTHKEQIPINLAAMDTDTARQLQVLRDSENYSKAFANIYHTSEIDMKMLVDVLGEFQKSLCTPSKFDHYLNGEEDALTAEQKAGYVLFKKYGCSSCHQGVNVGGNMFQRFGVMRDYFSDKENLSQIDMGRYNATGLEADRHVFKVPSLRNVALTAPYLHDRSSPTLEKTVEIMGKYQLGRPVPDEDVRLIVEFLKSLTNENLL